MKLTSRKDRLVDEINRPVDELNSNLIRCFTLLAIILFLTDLLILIIT